MSVSAWINAPGATGAVADARLPLIAPEQGRRTLAWRDGRPVSVAEFLGDVAALAAELPDKPYAINLCEERYRFLVAFCAALVRGQTCLLPSSRALHVVAEVQAAHPDSHCMHDGFTFAPEGSAVDAQLPRVRGGHVAVVGFTSGSTGVPRQHAKRWDSFSASTALNVARIRERLAASGAHGDAAIVATVPSQHMYGMETSVLLPLLGGMSVHGARPLFPADIAAALAEVPSPRVLVSTPVHLRALLESAQPMPEVALVLSATAPLDRALAESIEQRLGCEVLEVFGSTETCVIASRRTAHGDDWHLYPGVTLTPEPDGTRVDAPWFAAPNVLQDVVELLPDARFALRGRNTDLVDIAGKRASLGDLTRRLLAVPGVLDAVVFQPDPSDGAAVRRVAALVVAPMLDNSQILAALRDAIDPAFLPRPLVRVAALPRNEVGKLPRAALLAALRSPAY